MLAHSNNRKDQTMTLDQFEAIFLLLGFAMIGAILAMGL